MNTRNRFGVAALMTLALALCTGGAALADFLLPPPGSPSPAASGTAQTKYDFTIAVDPPFPGNGGYYALTRFQVSGLRPNTTYTFIVVDDATTAWWFNAVNFTTDRRGKGSGKAGWASGAPGTAVYTVVDAAGVVVLMGLEE